MSLKGSLDMFPLPEVLTLLASTNKSGELHISGEGVEGVIWLEDGLVVGSETGRYNRPVDTLFELLRLRTGDFLFEIGRAAPNPEKPLAIEPLLAEAEARLEEWKLIEAVVPSLANRVSLTAELPAPEVTISDEHWKVIVAVADGGTVDAAATRLGLGEFDACKMVKELVEVGLVDIAPPEQTFASRKRATNDLGGALRAKAAPAARPAASEPAAPEPARREAVVEDEAVPVASDGAASAPAELPEELDSLSPQAVKRLAAAANAATPEERDAALESVTDEHGEPINRTVLLKFLSSVRS